MNTGEEAVESDHGLLTTIGFQLSGEPVQYALEGSIFMAGAAIEWLEDVELVDGPAETVELARSVDSTDGVYVVPAFTGLGAPHWDGRARGAIIGMTLETRREHIVRATLESIAYQLRDVVEAAAVDSGTETPILKVDGGAVRNTFFTHLQADIVQTEIARPVVDETTALGSAYAAGLAVGYWDGIDDLRSNWQIDRRFSPGMDGERADELYENWRDAVERSLDSAEDRYSKSPIL
jgi:glycerol kinase